MQLREIFIKISFPEISFLTSQLFGIWFDNFSHISDFISCPIFYIIKAARVFGIFVIPIKIPL